MGMGSAKSGITHQPAFRARLAPTFTQVSINIWSDERSGSPTPKVQDGGVGCWGELGTNHLLARRPCPSKWGNAAFLGGYCEKAALAWCLSLLGCF